jgi:signal transduction histidine kinase
MGLRIMNYRARMIGGTLDIRPNGKAGTIVTCSLPYANGHKIETISFGASNGHSAAQKAALV